jgi:hypothetical protein
MHVLRVLLDCPFAGLHTGETHFMQEILLCSCICCASKHAIGERCLIALRVRLPSLEFIIGCPAHLFIKLSMFIPSRSNRAIKKYCAKYKVVCLRRLRHFCFAIPLI